MAMTQKPTALEMADSMRRQADYDVTTGMPIGYYSLQIQAANELRRLHARVVELESQLEAIGAGGVESLRKKEST